MSEKQAGETRLEVTPTPVPETLYIVLGVVALPAEWQHTRPQPMGTMLLFADEAEALAFASVAGCRVQTLHTYPISKRYSTDADSGFASKAHIEGGTSELQAS